MQPTQPVVAFIASVVVGIEAFPLNRCQSWAKAGAVLFAVCGAGFVVLQGLLSSGGSLSSDSKNLPLGTFYLLLQVSLGGLYPVFMKPMLARYDVIVLVAWAYVFGAGFILVSVLTCATSAADWEFVPISWAAIAYSAVFSSAAAYFLMAWCVRREGRQISTHQAASCLRRCRVNERSSPLLVSAFYPVQPIVTIFLSWAVEGEAPSTAYYFGGAAVVLGLLALLWLRAREAAAALQLQDDRAKVGARAKLSSDGVDNAWLLHAPPEL